MSGIVGPELLDLSMGLAVDVAWKTSLPLAAGLLLSRLPGTAAAKHLRLVAACAVTPIVGGVAVWTQSDVAVWTGAPVWPLVVWGVGFAVGVLGVLRALALIVALPTFRLPSGLEATTCLQTPITAGWLRPRIIVPADFDSWDATAKRAALAHERAHVVRRDWLVHMLVWSLTCVLWFNPLMWWTRKRVSWLAECAADDSVLLSGIAPTTYATQLLELARPGPRAALSFSISPVGARIRAVLDDRPRRGASAVSGLVVATVLGAAGVGVSQIPTWEPPPVVYECLPAEGAADLGPEPLGPIYLPYLHHGE